MNLSEQERAQLRACSAVLTLNRRELEWAAEQPRDVLGLELCDEVRKALTSAPVPGESSLVRMTTYLPAWIQYVGQRAVLLFPSLSRRILRGTGLHHQMY